MKKYIFLRKGIFQSLSKFEVKLNNMVKQGWHVHSFSQHAESTIVLLEREK